MPRMLPRVRLRRPVGALPLDLTPKQFERAITSDFGWRFHPIYLIPKKHKGVDLGKPLGTPVLAAKAGVVTTGRGSETGNYVLVKDGRGYTAQNFHLDTVNVSSGQHVDEGALLGRVGRTGAATGPHLHYGAKRPDGSHMDPMVYLGRRLPRAVKLLATAALLGGFWYVMRQKRYEVAR